MLKQGMLYSLRILMVVAVGSSLWLAGLILFMRLIPSSPEDTTTATDGIAIFTGGETRLQVALSLFEQKKGKYLLISGVNPDSSFPKTVDKMPFKSQVTLGYEALDTLGNAEETAAWAQANHIQSLRLITSNYHMPRSLFELRRLLPGVQILSHAVVGKSFSKPKWWIHPATLSLVIQEYNKFLFAFLRRPFEDMQRLLTTRENT